MKTLRIAKIIEESFVDGPGIRFVIFAQGCKNHCKNCHNPSTHDLNGGYEITIEEILSKIKANPLLSGVTFSGGEPFLQAKNFSELSQKIHKLNLNIITYTGYLFEDLVKNATPQNAWLELLKNTDILIDGPYIENQRSMELKFKGSKNQRIILTKDTLAQNKLIETEF